MTEAGTPSQLVVVGTSSENFAHAAETAILEAARTLRGVREGEVISLRAAVDGDGRPIEYRATVSLSVEP